MRAYGRPVNDPIWQSMNDAQWLWCYLNLQQDEREAELRTEDHLDYIASFINPEAVQQLREERKVMREQVATARGTTSTAPTVKRASSPNGQQVVNDYFEVELEAARLGYTPDMPLSPADYVAQHAAEAPAPLMEVIPSGRIRGNRVESQEEFIQRALYYEQLVRLPPTQPLATGEDGVDVIEVESDV